MDCFVFKREDAQFHFLISLFWLDFVLQGLEYLQIESVIVAKDREKSNLLLVAMDK
jgi:hypothetical protein